MKKKNDFIPYKGYVKKKKKSVPSKVKIICMIAFVLGLGIAYFVANQMQINDCFELIGSKNVSLNIGEGYNEPELDKAIKCVSFGFDRKSTIYIDEEESTFNSDSINVPGVYYIVYRTSDFKYSDIKRMRIITVSETSVDEMGE